MKSREHKSLIVGLDIGTSKIVAIVGELQPEGDVKIIGLGQHPSRGLKRGVVVNIDSTVAAIQRALEDAELMADCKIASVYTGIAGSHIKSINSHRHGHDQGRRSDPDGRRARDRDGASDQPAQRPADPAHPYPGIHHRRPGRRARAARHERHEAGSQGAHRHRGGGGSPEHRQVRAGAAGWKSTTWCCSRWLPAWRC